MVGCENKNVTEPGQIGREASTAKRAFRQIVQDLQRSGKQPIEGLEGMDVLDSQDRFNVWARSLGALQRGQASLDYRIGHAEIFHEVLRLLRQLNEYLAELLTIAREERQQLTWSRTSQKVTGDEFSDFELSSDDGSSYSASLGEIEEIDNKIITESSDLLLSANDSITSLMRLSIQIHRSSRKSKFSRCILDPNFDLRADRNHVLQLFPYANRNEQLTTRLAKANAQRRQWLIYRRQHVERLGIDRISSEIDSALARTTIGPEDSTPLERLVAPSLPDTIASTFRRSGTGMSTEITQSEYTETQHGLSTVVEGDQKLLVPEPPEDAKIGEPFPCPYCYGITEISGDGSWQKHVYADLSSYVCIFAGCDEPLFESRQQWMDHISKAHLIEWCCELCQSVHTSASSINAHILKAHADIPKTQLQALIDRCTRSIEQVPISACPLCDYAIAIRRKGKTVPDNGKVSARTFARHLSRHLEQLALFVLPRGALVENEDQEDDTQSSSSEEPEDDPEEEKVDAEAIEENIQALASSLAEKAVKQGETDVFLNPPDLAMGWQPPHDFTPPAEEFDTEDPDILPTRQEPIFGADLYTPGWARGFGAQKEGYCGRCAPGKWLNLPDGSYEFHMTYLHGSPASGVPLPRPSSIRKASKASNQWEGFCEDCDQWIIIRRTDRGWNWYWHYLLDHADVVQKRTAMIIAGADPESVAKLSVAKHPDKDQRLVEIESLLNGSKQGNSLHSALFVCIGQEDILLLRSIIEQCILNSHLDFMSGASELGKKLLLRSTYQGSSEITRYLLEVGASLEPWDTHSSTVLDVAIDAGFYQTACVLMDHGASRHMFKNHSSTLKGAESHIAADDTAEALDIECYRSELGWLSAAVKSGDVTTLQQTLQESSGPGNIDLEEGSDQGLTPLLLASGMDQYEIMTLLISQGANVNATNRLGWTPLMLAAKREIAATVQFLLANGADANHHSPDRWTALAEAASRSNKHIMRLLLDAGADPEAVSQHDWTPLMHVAYQGDVAAVNMLLDAGASVRHGSQRDETPLLLAAASGSAIVVRRLLDAGCAPDPDWSRPLLAAQEQPPPMPIERIYQLGWTPLMLACQVGSLSIVCMLLDAGANTEPRSPMFKNALEIARENGRVDIVSFLEHFALISRV